jgi:hypothetical protein
VASFRVTGPYILEDDKSITVTSDCYTKKCWDSTRQCNGSRVWKTQWIFCDICSWHREMFSDLPDLTTSSGDTSRARSKAITLGLLPKWSRRLKNLQQYWWRGQTVMVNLCSTVYQCIHMDVSRLNYMIFLKVNHVYKILHNVPT